MDAPRRIFVGERYLPQADERAALAVGARLGQAALTAEAAGSDLKLLSTMFVHDEEWAFDVFEAGSADQVRRLYVESDVAVERVTEGVLVARPRQPK